MRFERTRTQEHRVAGVVVPAVILQQSLVLERRNPPGVPPRVEAVRALREQSAVQSLLELRFGLAHRATHFAQHDAATHRHRISFPGLLELHMAALAVKVSPVEAGKEGGVQVDRKQIAVVGEIAGHEVEGGTVLPGQRVHRSSKGATQHCEEGSPARVALAAAHHQVLEYVGESARVRGGSPEGHEKGAVLAGRGEMQMPRTGGSMHMALEMGARGTDSGAAAALEARSRGAAHTLRAIDHSGASSTDGIRISVAAIPQREPEEVSAVERGGEGVDKHPGGGHGASRCGVRESLGPADLGVRVVHSGLPV